MSTRWDERGGKVEVSQKQTKRKVEIRRPVFRALAFFPSLEQDNSGISGENRKREPSSCQTTQSGQHAPSRLGTRRSIGKATRIEVLHKIAHKLLNPANFERGDWLSLCVQNPCMRNRLLTPETDKHTAITDP